MKRKMKIKQKKRNNREDINDAKIVGVWSKWNTVMSKQTEDGFVSEKNEKLDGYVAKTDIAPNKIGLYEFRAVKGDETTVFYMGKAGEIKDNKSTIRNRLYKYLYNGSHIKPYLKELLKNDYKIEHRYCKHVPSTRTTSESTYVKKMESNLLNTVDYALNKSENGDRRFNEVFGLNVNKEYSTNGTKRREDNNSSPETKKYVPPNRKPRYSKSQQKQYKEEKKKNHEEYLERKSKREEKKKKHKEYLERKEKREVWKKEKQRKQKEYQKVKAENHEAYLERKSKREEKKKKHKEYLERKEKREAWKKEKQRKQKEYQKVKAENHEAYLERKSERERKQKEYLERKSERERKQKEYLERKMENAINYSAKIGRFKSNAMILDTRFSGVGRHTTKSGVLDMRFSENRTVGFNMDGSRDRRYKN